MKILPVERIREADAYTIKNEPIADIDLMERAAAECFYWCMENIPHDKKILVFAGTGNNGGDGLAIARMMQGKGHNTDVYISGDPVSLSASCKINYERYSEAVGNKITRLTENDPLPEIDPKNCVVIDALFGSGISREITGPTGRIIHHINDSGAMVVSIDVPSGMFCDSPGPAEKDPAIIRATHTLTFAPPKLAFFFPENDRFAGEWHLLDIGIMQEFIDITETKNFFTEKEDCRKILRPRKKFSHKGNYGHVLLISGSTGKMGAAVLAAKGCIRSGPGLVTMHIPRSGNTIMQSSVPEAMISLDEDENVFSGIPDLSIYSAIAAGPGIGTGSRTQQALKLLIQSTSLPLIFDADAINILGENKTWISFVPRDSIFTPHPKEFERIAGKSSNDFERNQRQREFSVRFGVYVVLKGAHTAITTPDGECYFNSTGNPGMATGGSGDVLTGIIAGLKAQGYSSLESCLLGVYIHGLAGDMAAEAVGHEALIATDIISYLGKSFLTIYG